MIEAAQGADPLGRYHLMRDGDFNILDKLQFDLILSAFAFDNIPGADWRVTLLSSLGNLLKNNGRIVLLGSTPDIYTHEWTSFTTKDFLQNRNAKSGEEVQIVMKDTPDSRPVVDLIWFHSDYLNLFKSSGLELIERYLPLGREDEPYEWQTETSIAPWVIYVVAKESSR
jgi:hypothetical protein